MSGKGTLYVEIGKKLAISRQYPEFQKFLEVSRNDGILKFCVENQFSIQFSIVFTQFIFF